jgi:cytochrome c553
MMKHVIAAAATLLALAAMYRIYQLDREVDKLAEIRHIIEKTKMEVKLDTATQPVRQAQEAVERVSDEEIAAAQEKKKKELENKLKALKDKAGNVSAFKVSPLYKQKCASCHGVNGEGIIGPKLIGLSSDEVYKSLTDFKSGVRKNYVMYGLLSKMDEAQIKALSDEIGSFEQKLKAQQ